MNKFAYAYDNRDVRTGVQMKYGADPLRQVNYSYDAVDQLVGEAATGGVAATTYSNAYSYDAMGNRLRRENTQNTTTSLIRSSVNELNQLTSVSTSVDGGPRVTGGMSYDAAGNLTETTGVGGGRTLYVYDDADRLFRIEKRDAADAPLSKSEFIYDYASRKAVSQEFTYTAGAWVQSSEKRRVFDGLSLDVIQERDQLNQVKAQLVREGNIGGILSRSTAAGASFFSYDGSGNVTLLTDENGNDVGRYRYDAFGNTLEASGSRAAENPYRFSTKELHGASGLYDFGYRFYSASLGRWINRDPISEDGGLNLYAMVGNDPVNLSDGYGLSPKPTNDDGAYHIYFGPSGGYGWMRIYKDHKLVAVFKASNVTGDPNGNRNRRGRAPAPPGRYWLNPGQRFSSEPNRPSIYVKTPGTGRTGIFIHSVRPGTKSGWFPTEGCIRVWDNNRMRWLEKLLKGKKAWIEIQDKDWNGKPTWKRKWPERK